MNRAELIENTCDTSKTEDLSYMEQSEEWRIMMDAVAIGLFGITCTQALAKNICLKCKRQTVFTGPNADVFAKSYTKFGICQRCEEKRLGLTDLNHEE